MANDTHGDDGSSNNSGSSSDSNICRALDKHDARVSSAVAATVADARLCVACGATPHRQSARFCNSCGCALPSEDGYSPVEGLRASYRLLAHAAPNVRAVQRHSAQAAKPALPSSTVKPLSASLHAMSLHAPPRARHRTHIPARRARQLFMPTQNSSAAIALAFVAYALVPYLGILFCPGAIVMGIFGVRRASAADGHTAAWFSIWSGIGLFCLQLLLWWLLYRLPELINGF